MKKSAAILSIIMVLSVFIFNRTPVFSGEGPKKIVVLPFTMNADRDLAFMQEGIMDMLASRLTWKGQVSVVEKGKVRKKLAELEGPMDNDMALAVGRAFGADYVILGSLTIFGESVSIDARIVDVSKTDELLTAFNQSEGMDGVIPTINRFAQDINSGIMGRPSARPRPVTASIDRQGSRDISPRQKGGSGLIRVRQDDFWARDRKKVVRMDTGIIGMDMGDVDGDGEVEMVCIGNRTLYIYKWVEGRFAEISRTDAKWSPNFVWVDVADLNGNGRAEIYVSSLTASRGPGSFVMEWKGKGLTSLASGLSWFLRVLKHPVHGDILIGQKGVISGELTNDVRILGLENGKLVKKGDLELHKKANVFNFAMGEIVARNKVSTVLLSKADYLYLYAEGGDELWGSDDTFGGSLLYATDNEALPTELHFTPRVLLTDVDADGLNEVAVCRNVDLTGGWLEKVRIFRNGELYFLTWDGITLSTVMKSIKLSGAVTSYQIGDVDNDGRDELVIISVKEGWRFLGNTGKSTVVVLELGEVEE
ncbi:MAG: hypothetical protein GY864_15025 [Desulfobacterales bacterium]|nr:hypothetical protein [Desulfobacterales bacterium]